MLLKCGDNTDADGGELLIALVFDPSVCIRMSDNLQNVNMISGMNR
jgi:hypothetical protein